MVVSFNFVFIILGLFVTGYPTGAPETVCSDLKPQHTDGSGTVIEPESGDEQ